ARDAAGEPVTVLQRQRLESLFDALVRIAEPLLEPQHLFADDLEAEVPRLDRSRMHGTDGDFVHAVARDAHERIVLLSGLPRGRDLEIALQGKAVDRPCRLPGP